VTLYGLKSRNFGKDPWQSLRLSITAPYFVQFVRQLGLRLQAEDNKCLCPTDMHSYWRNCLHLR